MQNDITTARAAAQGSTPPKTALIPILDFLGLILPQEGVRCFVRINQHKKVKQGWVETNEDLAAAIEATEAGWDVYHACATYKDSSSRRRDNALSAKCFWLDIDCGDGKPYADADAAVNAVDDFANKLGIPLPLIVRSGRGVHAYWILSESIPRACWIETAAIFKRATEVLELHADPSRTADIASILRPPGSVNTKNGAIVTVDGTEQEIEFITHESFSAALQPYAATATAVSASSAPQFSAQPPQSLRNANLLGGLKGNYSMTQGYPDGQRTAQLLSRAGHLFAIGCSYEETLAQCRAWNQYNTPPKDDGRLIHDVQGIFKKETEKRKMQQIAQSTLSTVSVPTEWPEPQKVAIRLLPVQPLSLNILPDPFRPWVGDVAHRMQCPPDIAAAGAIVVTGSVIGAGCGIRPKRHDDWMVMPNLYGGAVGRPSVLMKSPTLAEMLKPLARLELEAKQAFDAAMMLHEAESVNVKAKRKAIIDGMAKAAKQSGNYADTLKEQYTALVEPKAPIWRRFRTNDSTIEKLSELLNENPRGILVFRDELTGLLTSWERSGHEQDRAYYLEAWNGCGSNFSDRIGRGTTYTENMCVSIFGGIQPAKLQQYFHDNRVANDGMFQRFQVLVCPDEPTDWKMIDQYPDKDAKNRAFEIIKKLSAMDFTQNGAQVEELDKIPFYRFADDAQEFFYEWLTVLEKQKIRSNDDPIFIEHLAKYKKLMPALALIFHLIDIADGEAAGAVSKAAAEKAAAWCDYLETHARRIYGLAGSLAMQAAASLARRIARGEVADDDKKKFTARDIYRRQWSMLTDIDVVHAACDILVGKNWLHGIETPSAFQQKGKVEYLINPKTRGFYR